MGSFQLLRLLRLNLGGYILKFVFCPIKDNTFATFATSTGYEKARFCRILAIVKMHSHDWI
jgi:hypothetical protein